MRLVWVAALAASIMPATATPFFFSTGTPDGLMAMASRTGSLKFEIETADDFMLTSPVKLTDATFAGLMPAGAAPAEVTIEIYRVFPKDSDTSRTSGPPTFATTQVPTRVNSPSDVAFASRDSTSTGLTFATTTISATFTAANSVSPGGIHAEPNQTTGGTGAVTGEEVEFSVHFATPIVLDPDHYFFVPQVTLGDGDFYWLSASHPITAPGTPFSPDLQAWTRDESLAPDWLRVGTDIIGGATPPTFNAVFTLSGVTPEPSVPEPAGLALIAGGLLVLAGRRRRS